MKQGINLKESLKENFRFVFEGEKKHIYKQMNYAFCPIPTPTTKLIPHNELQAPLTKDLKMKGMKGKRTFRIRNSREEGYLQEISDHRSKIEKNLVLKNCRIALTR